MKTKNLSVIAILAFYLSLIACSDDFLTVTPKGSLDQTVLANEEGINSLLIGAYSMLDGVSSQFGWESASSNWLYADIRSALANKGSDAGDASGMNPIQSYMETATNDYLNVKWRSVYEAISRCNNAINTTRMALDMGTVTAEQAESFIRQARALRGWYHFEAWRMWEMVPYVDENADLLKITNTEDIRPKIIADLTEGTSLPDNMGQVGRFNGTVCRILLARALMQMNHDWSSALTLLQEARNGTKPNGQPIGLAATYGEVFDIVNRNGIESVYTVQYSVNDGSGAWNAGWGEVLNFPYKSGGSPGGCCGFFQPNQEYVNSFRTSGGLPLLDNSYNNYPVTHDAGVPVTNIWNAGTTYDSLAYQPGAVVTLVDPAEPVYRQVKAYKSLIFNNKGNNPLSSPAAWELTWQEDTGTLDPRIDWSAGRRGIPYWDWGIHTGQDWIRDQSYAGPYSPKKQVYKKSQEGQYTEVGNWTSGWTANGYRMIRYADVLLLLAECQIETGDLAGALANINAVRTRAANPDGFVMEDDGATPAANYEIGPYPNFPDAGYARKALRMERKLELGMEGHRLFDLLRWGIAQEEVNRVLEYERTQPWGRSLYYWASFGPEDITYPIPQRQIDLSHGNLVQNKEHIQE